jgi:thiamine pyrophosphate-dependent acetolactate synthase large subunit-like protein
MNPGAHVGSKLHDRARHVARPDVDPHRSPAEAAQGLHLFKYGRESGTRFGEPDIVKFAESFGAIGLRSATADQLEATMKRALELSGPVVVDVPIDYRDNVALGDMLHPGQFN